MANKSISELDEYVGLIQGDEILIISKEEENAGTYQYVSKYYKLQTLANEVSSSVLYVVSNDVSTFISDTSALISNLTADVSTAISIIANTSAVISTFLNDVSTHVSNDLSTFKNETSSSLCAFVENAIPPLKKIMGLSTLNYYTFIGDDINKLSADPKYPELSSLSDDVIWFDTKDDPNFHRIANIRRMDNLQVQIYRLGLQLRDVHKILENGVIPGDAYNNTKDEMIEFADEVQPPDESLKEGKELLAIHVYGNYFCKNGQLYYILFDPSGFVADKTSFEWIFDEPDTDSNQSKTLQLVSSDIVYSLKAHIEQQYLSSIAQIKLSAAVNAVGEEPTFVSDQVSVDNVINILSANQLNEMSFYISSDFYDETFKEYIVSEPFDVSLKPGSAVRVSSEIEIQGNEYIDKSTLYYCILDETKKKFPLNVDTTWYFLSSGYVEDEHGEKQLSVVKTDSYKKKFFPDDDDTTRIGEVTYNLLHFVGTPICQVSVSLSNCTQIEAKDVSASLFVESNYDNALSAQKDILGLGGLQPLSSIMEPTVKAVCAKVDTKADLAEKIMTMHKGELVYFTDTDQLAVFNGEKFMVLNSSSSSGLSKEEIQDIGLDYLTFSSSLSGVIMNKMTTTSDGKVNIIQKNKNDSASDYGYDNSGVGKVWVSHWLQIGKVYAGGKAMTYNNVIKDGALPTSLVSHNFVEIVNASDNDINLDKIYLMYHTTDASFAPDASQSGNSQWEFLKLEGVIKAHGTYLVRGAKCNPCKNIMIDVDKCDLEWRKRKAGDADILNGDYKKFTRSGDLIEFSQNAGSFFLIYATNNGDGTGNGNNIKSVVLSEFTPTDMISDADNKKGGYVDLVGIGPSKTTCLYYENTPYSSPTGSFNNILVHKWYYMDPAKQGNKVLYEITDGAMKFRSNKTLLDGVNLEKQQVINYGSDAAEKRDQYYYDDEYKKQFKPGTSNDNNGIFSDKTHFIKEKPNMVTITFGKQATCDDSDPENIIKASRCFNWISLGYFDEYVEARKKNDNGTFGEWKRFYSITANDDSQFIKPFHQFYDRIRWTASDGALATTHKVVARNEFEDGTWQFRIGREGDSSYASDINEFIVKKNSDITKFSFIQTSDQQGFNFIEYQAWKAACTAISQHENAFDFTINTGDIAQSGNRVNEWIDYYFGKKAFGMKEEMFTIGNNDLCGAPAHVLGDGEDNTSKFNLINILYYYTFELDPANMCFATFEGVEYPIYSLYSFDYGEWHFISLVSEIRSYYAKAFPVLAPQETKYAPFAKTLNARVEEWFKTDLQAYMDKTGESNCSKCIVFMHEMPFTMVTPDFFDLNDAYWGSVGRTTASTGSKLNLENANGNYRFSRLFKKAGIRLVIGGHKHTFTLSNPLYDASADKLVPDTSIALTADLGSEDPFISHVVDESLSHKPIIEMPMAGVTKFVKQKIDSDISSKPASLVAQFNTLKDQLSAATDIGNVVAFNASMKDILDLANENEITSFASIDTGSARLSNFLRIQYVKDITAPTYAMSQATGYKVVSNKELPSATSDSTGICRQIPWLMSYCAATESTKTSSGKSGGNFSSTKNPVQLRPTYIRYDIDSNAISVELKQVDGVYTIDSGGNQSTYNLDAQSVVLSCNSLTFGAFGKRMGKDGAGKFFIPTTSDDYMSIYSDYIKDDTYIIKL